MTKPRNNNKRQIKPILIVASGLAALRLSLQAHFDTPRRVKRVWRPAKMKRCYRGTTGQTPWMGPTRIVSVHRGPYVRPYPRHFKRPANALDASPDDRDRESVTSTRRRILIRARAFI
jgi:hypothetical protein